MWEAIRANKRKSVFLISLMGILLAALGASIGGGVFGVESPRPMLWGVLIAGIIWFILTMAALYSGRDIMLAVSGAREVKHTDAPQLYNIVEEMSIAASLPKPPKVFIMEERAPNAFAVGTPDNAAVAVTTGLLSILSRDELQGVVAHEIGHIKNQDSNFMTIAGVMLGTIVIIADVFVRSVFYGAIFGGRRRSRSDSGGGAQMLIFLIAIVLAVLAPILAQLLYFACSRSREYLADACSAVFTRYPEGLASALEKISGGKVPLYAANRVTAPMYIIPPIMKASDDDSAPTAILSTHPPTMERIKILRSMGTKIGFASYNSACENVKGKGVIGAATLRSDEELEMRGLQSERGRVDVKKQTRDATDILHKLNGFLFIPCSCGLQIKVPPTFSRNELKCPKCGALHNVSEIKTAETTGRNG
jgi:heat shock protein HtpX